MNRGRAYMPRQRKADPRPGWPVDESFRSACNATAAFLVAMGLLAFVLSVLPAK